MKLKIKLFLAVTVFALVLSMLQRVPEAKAATTITLYSSQDSYVFSSFPTTRYGQVGDLDVAMIGSWNMRTWIMFNLTSFSVGSTITNAKVYLYQYYTGPHAAVNIYQSNNDAWNDSATTGINWNNQPTYNTTAIESKTPTTGAWMYFTVSGEVQGAINNASDRVITFALLSTTLQAEKFYSKEATSYHPYLMVTTTTAMSGYRYDFYGLYDEGLGALYPLAERAVNVTCFYYNGTQETFEVNGTYSFYTNQIPRYFVMNTTTPRQYWLSEAETSATIYILNQSLTLYTITFNDYAGVLKTYSFINAKMYLNGTYITVEKRKVDYEDKVQMALINGKKYDIVVSDGTAAHTFGDLAMTSTTSIELTLKGIEFPSDIVFGYSKVHMYMDRTSNNTQINFYYEDTTNQTSEVTMTVYHANSVIAYQNIKYGLSDLTLSWLEANYSAEYYGTIVAEHPLYGTLTYKSTFGRGYSTAPFGLDFLGHLPGGYATSTLLPIFFIICAFGLFSALNPYVGMFAGIMITAFMVWIGWISLGTGGVAMLVLALAYTILYAIARKRRGEIEVL